MSNQPICNQDTPDPWVLLSPLAPPQQPLFYLTFTLGNRIEIWSSTNVESFNEPHVCKTVIWQPPPGSPWSADIWAPELHYNHNTWWIYAASAQPAEGNPSHRTIVLRCLDQDPMGDSSRWIFHGPLKGLPADQWSIDATVFSPDPPVPHANAGADDSQRRWYVCYSGWPLGDHSDTQQDLFLARLISPLEADRASLTVISRAELAWERPENGRRGVNEGMSWVEFPAAGWCGIVYSANGSWTSDYKLGMLRFVGGQGDDLCNAALWRKRPLPLLTSDPAMGGPFGPGHASFVPAPDGRGLLCVYHATERVDEGWNNRKGRVMYFTPGVFDDHAQPMLCAYRYYTAMMGNAQGGFGAMPAQGQGLNQQQQYPGQQAGQQVTQNSSEGGGQHGHGSGFAKYADNLEKKIPGQYQGMFRKAKDFFK